MKSSKKIIATFILTSLLAVSVIVSTCGGMDSKLLLAECSHNGYHYSEIRNDSTTYGVKEFWVCCNCHEHFLNKPTIGKWTDSVLNENQITEILSLKDDRTLYPYTKPDENGFTYSEDGKTITSYTPVKGETNVVIPEGVTEIADGVFKGTNITSVTIPSTVTKIGENAFANTGNLHSIVIPATVLEVEQHAFFDDDYSFFGLEDINDIVIYLEITEKEAKEKYEEDWDVAYKSYFILFSIDHRATVYYKGEWHYDKNGNPTPNY